MDKDSRELTTEFGTFDWLPLKDVLASFVRSWGGRDLAAGELYRVLLNGQLRSGAIRIPSGSSRVQIPERQERSVLPREFWRQVTLTVTSEGRVRVRPEPATAINGEWYFYIWRPDLDTLFPKESPAPVAETASPEVVQAEKGFTAGAAWIAAEVERMKAAGEIETDIQKAALARELATRMKQAARRNPSIRPITWKSISNQLKAWGLWPIG
jgi:hypothetical protein